jgi:oxygen-dependent protoporphyrinogen oxidase
VTVVEGTGRPGGVLASCRDDGWLVERSADNVLAARPEAVAMIERLGLDAMLVGVAPAVRRALVWHRGRGLPAPAGFRLLAPGSVAGILRTPLLSAAGRLRVLAERFVPSRRRRDGALDDESLESFAVRRLGREAFDRLVQPLAAGIWTADPARLGMAAACPEFFAMERDAGSLWAGERARLRRALEPAAAGVRYGQFVTLRDGMETLPTTLAEHLRRQGASFVTARATALRQAPSGWHVALESAEGPAAPATARAVVLAVPASSAARLLRPLDAGLADDLAGIDYAGSAIVSLGYARGDVAHPLDAAGMVVPRVAGRRALAVSFSSSKFPGRAPEGHVLVRVFLGGALDPGVLDLNDQALAALARTEMERLIGARGRPKLERVDRWHEVMPQYHVGHVARVERIAVAVTRHAGLAIAGAAYHGVGIPQVIASGQAAAARIGAAPSVDR